MLYVRWPKGMLLTGVILANSICWGVPAPGEAAQTNSTITNSGQKSGAQGVGFAAVGTVLPLPMIAPTPAPSIAPAASLLTGGPLFKTVSWTQTVTLPGYPVVPMNSLNITGQFLDVDRGAGRYVTPAYTDAGPPASPTTEVLYSLLSGNSCGGDGNFNVFIDTATTVVIPTVDGLTIADGVNFQAIGFGSCDTQMAETAVLYLFPATALPPNLQSMLTGDGIVPNTTPTPVAGSTQTLQCSAQYEWNAASNSWTLVQNYPCVPLAPSN